MKKNNLLLAIFFISGACGLIYEIVWMRMLKLIFGSTILASSITLASFMAGLSIGSYLFGKFIDKDDQQPYRDDSQSDRDYRQPLNVFAMLMLGIGVYSFFTPFIFKLIQLINISLPFSRYTNSENVYYLSGGITVIVLLLSFAALIIPTILMGGTLPVLCKYFKQYYASSGRTVAILYSVNTWGGVLGSLVCCYFLVQYLGIHGTLYMTSIINAGIGIFLLGKSFSLPDLRNNISQFFKSSVFNISKNEVKKDVQDKIVLIVIGLSGFAALGYEVLWTRILSMIIGSSFIAFSLMLCAFLLGIASGSAIYSKLEKKISDPGFRELGFVELGIGAAVLLLIPLIGILPLSLFKIYSIVGNSLALFHFFNFVLILAVMFLPTVLFGLTIPLACQIYARKKDIATSIGTVYFYNTAGSIFGALAAGFVLIPLAGLQKSMVLLALLNFCLSIPLLYSGLRDKKWLRAIIIFSALFSGILYFFFSPGWDKKVLTSGLYQYAPLYIEKSKAYSRDSRDLWKAKEDFQEILFYREGRHFTVVVSRQEKSVSLSIDGKFDASNNVTSDMVTQLLVAHLPLLIHPDPKKVLVIGLASGISLGAVTRWENVERIDCVEIEPCMIEASHYFDEYNNDPLKDRRVNLIIDDGRNYLLTTKEKYDVIIVEPSNPWISGCASFFTRDFYKIARSKLKDDGVASFWLQVYDVQSGDYEIVKNTINSVFSNISIWGMGMSDTLVLATANELLIDYEEFKKRFDTISMDLKRISLDSANSLLAAKFITVPDHRKGKLNTDNYPLIELKAGNHILHRQIDTENYRRFFENSDKPITRYLKNFGDYEGIAKAYLYAGSYGQAERILNSGFIGKNSARYYNLQGFLFFKKNQYQEAIKNFKTAVAIDPVYTEPYRYLANIFFRTRQLDSAISCIRRSIQLDPKNAEAYNIEGMIYIQKGEYQDALERFQKGKQVDPAFLASYINLSILYLNFLREPEKAVIELEEALEHDPYSGQLYYMLAKTYAAIGNESRADEALSNAIFYDFQIGENILEKIK